MRGTAIAGIVGGGLFIVGIVFGVRDPKLFDHWYDWVLGPLFWIAGCTLMIAWVFGRFHMPETARLKRISKSPAFIEATEPTRAIYQQSHVERRREERRRGDRRSASTAA